MIKTNKIINNNQLSDTSTNFSSVDHDYPETFADTSPKDSGKESDNISSNPDIPYPLTLSSGDNFKRLRTKSSKRRLRWQSFYNAHQPSFRSRPIQLNALSAGQVRISFIFYWINLGIPDQI